MKSDGQVLEELKQAAEGLTFMSESDYPLEVIHWEGVSEVSPEYLCRLTGLPAETPVRVESVAEFFRAAASEAAWKGEAGITEARRYQALMRLLSESLTGTKAYRVGTVNAPVYVVGRCSPGNWMGVSTRVVET